MKKIIEKLLLTLFVLTIFVQFSAAQRTKTTNIKNAGTVNIGQNIVQGPVRKVKDSIPPLADTADFISNVDLVQLNQIIRRVICSDQYKQAGEPISQYEILVTYMNQVFIAARNRWEQKNKVIKK